MNVRIFNRNIRLYFTEREIQAIVQEHYYCRLFVVREEHLDVTNIGPHSCPTYPMWPHNYWHWYTVSRLVLPSLCQLISSFYQSLYLQSEFLYHSLNDYTTLHWGIIMNQGHLIKRHCHLIILFCTHTRTSNSHHTASNIQLSKMQVTYPVDDTERL